MSKRGKSGKAENHIINKERLRQSKHLDCATALLVHKKKIVRMENRAAWGAALFYGGILDDTFSECLHPYAALFKPIPRCILR